MIGFTTVSAQFSIGPGGYVTIKQGGTLMIDMDLHIRSDATGSGYLVDQTTTNDVEITGDVSVERYMTADVWHNVSSPVSNENTTVYTTDLVFWYNEALILNDWNFGWVWYTGVTGGPLMIFRGYDVLYYTNPVTVNYQAIGSETVNTGPFNIGVIITNSTPGEIASHKGWNLLGNPYPSPVDWLAGGWDKSDINDAKYIWDGANDIYTIYTGGSAPIGVNGGTRFIPSNQGFWVQAVNVGTVSIDNTVRIGDITGTPDFYKTEPIDYPMVSLWAVGDNGSDEAVIRFLEGTTAGFDINYDASKLFSLNPEMPQISVRSGNKVLALNSYPEFHQNFEVPLGFRSSRPGLYEIRLGDRSTLDPSVPLFLADDLTGNLIRFGPDSSYSFLHDPSNPENRFRLIFNPSDDVIGGLGPGSWFTVYFSGDQFHIIKNTNRELSGTIVIYDISGRPAGSARLENATENRLGFSGPAGCYIVRLVTGQGTLNAKVIVSR